MIMDSFASLALATEDPNPDLLKRAPYPRNQPVLSPSMTRFLMCHSLWQMMILFVFIFLFGDICPESEGLSVCTPGTVLVEGWGDIRSGRPATFDDQFLPAQVEDCPPVFNPKNPSSWYSPSNNKSEKIPMRPPGFCSEAKQEHDTPTQHYTMVFTIFVLLQLFNQINARKIHGEFKVWDGLFDNKYFLYILGMEACMQIFMVQFPGVNTAMGCTGLTMTQWVFCFLVGATALPLNLIVTQLPLTWFTYNLARGKSAGKDEDDKPGKKHGDGIKLLSMVDQ
jgi:Ca2+ transporting ATPase